MNSLWVKPTEDYQKIENMLTCSEPQFTFLFLIELTLMGLC